MRNIIHFNTLANQVSSQVAVIVFEYKCFSPGLFCNDKKILLSFEMFSN